jgi:thiol-disulfide isomerase/thioredoxin
VVLAGCSNARSGDNRPAPPFELKDLSGKSVNLASFKGKVVLLDFWATWCGPCRISIPMVQEFYSHYQDKGVAVLGLNIDEDPSGVFGFVKRFKMTYPVLYAGGTAVPSDFEVEGIPLFILLDQEGRMVRRYEGFSPQLAQAWEADVQRLLKNP